MEFEFIKSIYISDDELEEITEKVKQSDEDLEKVVHKWSYGFDDDIFYDFDYILDDVCKEVRRRLTEK